MSLNRSRTLLRLERLVEGLVELRDDLARRAGGRHEAQRGLDDDALVALLGEGRDHRCHRAALEAGDAEPGQLAGLEMADHRRHVLDHEIDLARDHRGQRRRRAAIGDVLELDPELSLLNSSLDM